MLYDSTRINKSNMVGFCWPWDSGENNIRVIVLSVSICMDNHNFENVCLRFLSIEPFTDNQ